MEGESSPQPTQVEIGKNLLRNYFAQMTPEQQQEGIVLSQIRREIEEQGVEIKYKYLYDAYKKLEAEQKQAADEGRAISPIPKLKETHVEGRDEQVVQMRREGLDDQTISKKTGLALDTIRHYGSEGGESRTRTTQFSDKQMLEAALVYGSGGDINTVAKALGLDRNGAMAVLAAAKRRGIVERKTPTEVTRNARDTFLDTLFMQGYTAEEMFRALEKESAFSPISLSRMKALYTKFLRLHKLNLSGYDEIERWRNEQKIKYAQVVLQTPDESRDVAPTPPEVSVPEEQALEETQEEPIPVEIEPEELPQEIEHARPFYQPEQIDLSLPQRNSSKKDRKKEFERQKRKQEEQTLLAQQRADEEHRLKQQQEDH